MRLQNAVNVKFTLDPFFPSFMCDIVRMVCHKSFHSFCFSLRQQVTEIIFVLKAVSTLMDSLKKTLPENGKYFFITNIKLFIFMLWNHFCIWMQIVLKLFLSFL